MSNDPHAPGYEPHYTGASGNYGSGKELGADLYAPLTASSGVDDKCGDLDSYVGNMKAGDVVGSRVNSWIPIQPDASPGPGWYHESRS